MSINGKARIVSRRSLSQSAYDTLRTKILRGDLPLGTPLSRRKLALELAMSMLPVGEALQRLETDGLIESRPRVGTRVRIPTEDDVRGHYVLREALETMSARLFAERATPAERVEMMECALTLDTLYDKANLSQGNQQAELVFEAHQLHAQFHMRLAEYSRCPALYEAIDRNQTIVLNWLFNSASQFYKLPPHWHRTLMNELNHQSPSSADKAMRKHVRYGVDQVTRRIKTLATVWVDSEKGFRVRG